MAGWSKGLGEIASGALSAGAAFMKSDKAVAVMKGGAKAFEGVGELFGAMHDAKKVDNQADATAAGNAADYLKRQLDELSQVANEAANQIESAIDRAGQGAQLQAQQGSALVFIRG
ncbi:MAG: hypothetical protein QM756_36930 [Polyangiaceae bacterium]